MSCALPRRIVESASVRSERNSQTSDAESRLQRARRDYSKESMRTWAARDRSRLAARAHARRGRAARSRERDRGLHAHAARGCSSTRDTEHSATSSRMAIRIRATRCCRVTIWCGASGSSCSTGRSAGSAGDRQAGGDEAERFQGPARIAKNAPAMSSPCSADRRASGGHDERRDVFDDC